MPDFKTFYNAMVTKQACNSHKKKWQTNGKE
jgi:hypothetical protein